MIAARHRRAERLVGVVLGRGRATGQPGGVEILLSVTWCRAGRVSPPNSTRPPVVAVEVPEQEITPCPSLPSFLCCNVNPRRLRRVGDPDCQARLAGPSSGWV